TASLRVTYGTCTGSDPGGVILPPIHAGGTSVFQHGSTVPVKFKVCDANGNSISDPNAVFASGSGSVTMITNLRGTVDNINEATYNDIPDSAFHFGSGGVDLQPGYEQPVEGQHLLFPDQPEGRKCDPVPVRCEV